MSRKIDLTKPLSEEDVNYLKARGTWGERRIALNSQLVASAETGDDEEELSSEEKAKLLAEATAWINKASVAELKAKAEEWELSTDGNKAELQERLLDAVNKEYGSDED